MQIKSNDDRNKRDFDLYPYSHSRSFETVHIVCSLHHLLFKLLLSECFFLPRNIFVLRLDAITEITCVLFLYVPEETLSKMARSPKPALAVHFVVLLQLNKMHCALQNSS